MRKQLLGMMLIEWLIASLLGCCLLVVIGTIVSKALQHQRLIVALARLQDNQQFVAHYLVEQLQRVGQLGCARLTADFPLLNHTMSPYAAASNIAGTMDQVTIRPSSREVAFLQQPLSQRAEAIVAPALAVKAGDSLIIADCNAAEIVRVTSAQHYANHTQLIHFAPALTHPYSPQAELHRLEIFTYYTAATKRRDGNGNIIYALFQENSDHHMMELVEGVQTLHVVYDMLQRGKLRTVSDSRAVTEGSVIGVALTLEWQAMHAALPVTKEYLYAAIHG